MNILLTLFIVIFFFLYSFFLKGCYWNKMLALEAARKSEEDKDMSGFVLI